MSFLMIIGKIKWIVNLLLLLSLVLNSSFVPVVPLHLAQIQFCICRLAALLVVVLCVGVLDVSQTCAKNARACRVILFLEITF
jgi:hypothetical protein